MNRIPTLIGIGGPFKGEIYQLEHFKPCVIGRSRKVDISVKRTQHYKAQSEAERDADEAAKTISARHFQITFFNLQSIEIKNFSVNGTLVDGKRVESSALIKDIASRPHEIRFGREGRFKLALCAKEENPSEPLPLE